MGMKRVNTKGIAGAEKHVLMASMCYNLQKLLKFKKLNSRAIVITIQTKIESFADKFFGLFFACFRSFSAKISRCFSGLKITTQNLSSLKQVDLSADFRCFVENITLLEKCSCATGTLIVGSALFIHFFTVSKFSLFSM